MHGKILRYSLATGVGVVSNHSKKIFELRKESWHDTRYLPTAGMLIEFRCNSNGYIVNAKASVYQSFPPDSFIKESDFWKSDTDEELLYKEQEMRELLIQKIFKETNYFSIKKIPLSLSVEKSVEKYFLQELSTINFNMDKKPTENRALLNYLETKRFLNKAIDYLVFTDKNITTDAFSDQLLALNKLNYSYNYFVKNTNINASKIFIDYFLETQLHYCAAMKAQQGLKERIMELNTRVKNSVAEIKGIYIKIEGKKDTKNLESRLKILKQRVSKSDEELKILTPCLKNLEKSIEDFKQLYKKDFEQKFQNYYNAIVNQTTRILNIYATDLDDSIWKLAMNSIPIHNTFFKQNIIGSYCTMTFLWLYLQKLDKNKLSPNDKKAYAHYLRYKQTYEKVFLVFTTNHKLETYLKIQIMSEAKYNSVIIAKTNAEFFSQINSNTFKTIYIDSTLSASIPSLISEIKKTKRNTNTNLVLIPKEKIDSLKD
ncbi:MULTISPECIES: hypothetical protein [unclassified Helicobacter]|uniref:hypothetical protein n=1 Tax=unclassified Helicobacter TaxID=2593540 RepID=UPI000CF0D83A|nr:MULTISPECIES: hypothetical protein [unclassified Helicobacter]